jgi:hypothetical protein
VTRLYYHVVHTVTRLQQDDDVASILPTLQADDHVVGSGTMLHLG